MLKEKQDWIVGTDHKMDFLKSNTHKKHSNLHRQITRLQNDPNHHGQHGSVRQQQP